MKFIGIVGARIRNSRNDFMIVKEKFYEIYQEGDEIISGGCRSGADRFAEEIARQGGTPIKIYFPNWKQLGKSAVFIRNMDIAKNSTALIACVSRIRSGGTEDTIDKFKEFHPEGDIYIV